MLMASAMGTSVRYLKERDDFVSRASLLLPWLTPKRLTYLAYWADTDAIGDRTGYPADHAFSEPWNLRLDDLRRLGRLDRFRPSPPWIERRIPKRNGRGIRTLYVPAEPLKQLQRFVLRAHLSRLQPDRAAYGFERGRSRRKHAELHCNRSVVVCLDIRRFFPSLPFERIEEVIEVNRPGIVGGSSP